MIERIRGTEARSLLGCRLVWLAVPLAILCLQWQLHPALAHTQLLSTDPPDGVVLAAAPDTVTFTFNEPVDPVEDAFVLLDASGESHPLEVSSDFVDVTVTLPSGLGNGTVVVGWRVISADGHPVSGALTFSIGEAGEAPAGEIAASDADLWVERALGVTQGVGYLGLLIAAGLVVFRLLVVSTGGTPQPVTWAVAAWAAAISIAGTALSLPLTVARQRALSLGDLTSIDRWTAELDTHEVRSLVLLALGLIIAIVAARRLENNAMRVVAAVGVGLAVISPTLSGHTNSFDPRWVFRLSNVLHTAAGAIWLGGLIGLLVLLGRSSHHPTGSPEAPARVVSRFSAVAGGVVAALLLSGVINAWITLGALDALWNTSYGQLVLVKAAVVAIVICFAVWNHFRLVPKIESDASDRSAWSHLRRTVVAEAALLCFVALLTGFLVNQSPLESNASGTSGPLPTARFDIAVGDGRMIGSIDPAALGQSEMTFTLTDANGDPLEPVEAPEVKLYLRATDIGPLTSTAIAGESPGAFTASIQFPSTGLWDIEIPIRISRFEETTAKVTVEIR